MNNSKIKLLLISNNVLSKTKNNGKTLLSFFDGLENSEIKQLFFSSESPSVFGYDYFRISDSDIIKGYLSPKKRGKRIEIKSDNQKEQMKKLTKKSNFKRFLREIVWKKWKSKQLIEWLDEFGPTSVFFVGGDCCFAYSIYDFICQRYNITNSSLYITDDYIAKRKRDSFFGKIRRRMIKKSIEKSLLHTKNFFTISSPMKDFYKTVFGRDSTLLVNMSLPLKSTNSSYEKPGMVTLIYAGSLYYGRDEILGSLSKAITLYQKLHPKVLVCFKIYTNDIVSETQKRIVSNGEHTIFGGHLSFEDLTIELNKASILVFVESFDESFLENTKYSLSTKVPEYLSLEKPILAIGPDSCGSIQYLRGVSAQCHTIDDIYPNLEMLIENHNISKSLSERAFSKYYSNNYKLENQKKLYNLLFKEELV